MKNRKLLKIAGLLVFGLLFSYTSYSQNKKEQITELIGSLDSCGSANVNLINELEKAKNEKNDILSQLLTTENQIRTTKSDLNQQNFKIDSLLKKNDLNINFGAGAREYTFEGCELASCILEIEQLTKNSFRIKLPNLSNEECECSRMIFELEKIGQEMKIVKAFVLDESEEYIYELEFIDYSFEDYKFFFLVDNGKLSAVYVENNNLGCCEIAGGGYYPYNND